MKNVKHDKLKIGVSSCLLGQLVRFDGGHKKQPFLTDTLDRFVQWVPVCPEVEMGLGVPRPTMRLESQDGEVRLRVPKTSQDLTSKIKNYSKKRVAQIKLEGLNGYILKKDSPSCGLTRVKVYDPNGVPKKEGVGFFAKELTEKFPTLPVEDEGRINDPRIRENFITRVFAHYRWKELYQPRITKDRIFKFHQYYKLHLMARNQMGQKRLGHMLANMPKRLNKDLVNDYFQEFSKVMSKVPGRKGHANVLFHMTGYFSKQITKDDRAEMKRLVEMYLNDELPLIAPLVMIQHYVRKYEVEYLQSQVYLFPHPSELSLLGRL